MTNVAVTELCLPGLVCPMPVLKAKKALALMAAGERLLVKSTDKHAWPDLADFCERTGNRFIERFECDEDGHHYYAVLIERKPSV